MWWRGGGGRGRGEGRVKGGVNFPFSLIYSWLTVPTFIWNCQIITLFFILLPLPAILQMPFFLVPHLPLHVSLGVLSVMASCPIQGKDTLQPEPLEFKKKHLKFELEGTLFSACDDHFIDCLIQLKLKD